MTSDLKKHLYKKYPANKLGRPTPVKQKQKDTFVFANIEQGEWAVRVGNNPYVVWYINCNWWQRFWLRFMGFRLDRV